jgi:translocator protein
MSRIRSGLVLVAFVGISLAVGALGAIATIQNVTGWYATAEKAFWSPPNGLFSPVWTVLYLLIGVSGWLVWRERSRARVSPALTIYVVQLVLNALWAPVFFALYPLVGVAALWLALCLILAIDVTVLLTMLRFWKVRRAAAVMLVPYWAWVLFATSLNVAIAVLN